MKKVIIAIVVCILLAGCSNKICIERFTSTVEDYKYEYKISQPLSSLNYDSVLFFADKLFDEEDQTTKRDMVTQTEAKEIVILSNKEYFKEE